MLLTILKVIFVLVGYIAIIMIIARFFAVCAAKDVNDNMSEKMEIKIDKDCTNCVNYDNAVKQCKIHNNNKVCKDYKYI